MQVRRNAGGYPIAKSANPPGRFHVLRDSIGGMLPIGGKGTAMKRAALEWMLSTGITPESQARDLAGRPDIVLWEQRIARRVLHRRRIAAN